MARGLGLAMGVAVVLMLPDSMTEDSGAGVEGGASVVPTHVDVLVGPESTREVSVVGVLVGAPSVVAGRGDDLMEPELMTEKSDGGVDTVSSVVGTVSALTDPKSSRDDRDGGSAAVSEDEGGEDVVDDDGGSTKGVEMAVVMAARRSIMDMSSTS